MDLANLVRTVTQVAPLLGAILPIPAGKEIGKIIAHEFGGDLANPDDLVSRILEDPQAHIKLIEIQSNTKVQLQQLLVQKSQNELAAKTAQLVTEQQDRSEARKLGQASRVPAIVTFIIITGFFFTFVALLLWPNHHPYEQVLYMMVGSISSAFGGAVSYWLGSSVGSRHKDNAIHNALSNLSV
jgi:hypothetical protein